MLGGCCTRKGTRGWATLRRRRGAYRPTLYCQPLCHPVCPTVHTYQQYGDTQWSCYYRPPTLLAPSLSPCSAFLGILVHRLFASVSQTPTGVQLEHRGMPHETPAIDIYRRVNSRRQRERYTIMHDSNYTLDPRSTFDDRTCRCIIIVQQ